LTDSKKGACGKHLEEGVVSAAEFGALRKGIVSGSNMQQVKDQIPKSKDSK
jgi:hypothetical protein